MQVPPLRSPRRVVALAFVTLGLAALSLAEPPSAGATEQELDPSLARLEAGLHRAVNALRAGRGLNALRRDAALDDVASAHSSDMIRRGYLSHDTPEGVNPVQRIRAAGIAGLSLAGENVGRTNRPEPNREILDGWRASPVHRVNLLAPAFNATGIGIRRAPHGSLYYTQLYVTFPR